MGAQAFPETETDSRQDLTAPGLNPVAFRGAFCRGVPERGRVFFPIPQVFSIS